MTSHPSYSHLEGLNPVDLDARRRAIVEKAQGDYQNLDDRDLNELAFISQTLRARNAGPPKAPKGPKSPKGGSRNLSLDALTSLLPPTTTT